jgi:hypothetical protein
VAQRTYEGERERSFKEEVGLMERMNLKWGEREDKTRLPVHTDPLIETTQGLFFYEAIFMTSIQGRLLYGFDVSEVATVYRFY